MGGPAAAHAASERRLAGAEGTGDDRELALYAPVEQAVQAGADDQMRWRGGHRQFGQRGPLAGYRAPFRPDGPGLQSSLPRPIGGARRLRA